MLPQKNVTLKQQGGEILRAKDDIFLMYSFILYGNHNAHNR